MELLFLHSQNKKDLKKAEVAHLVEHDRGSRFEPGLPLKTPLRQWLYGVFNWQPWWWNW
jgi:hypothetical protein